MKHKLDCPEDLSVLARRGQLSSDQLDQLQRLLEGSATLRTADQVGRAFDRVAEVHQGDEQRIALGVDRVMTRLCAPAARVWRGWRLALVAAIVFATTSAAAVAGFFYLPLPTPTQRATPSTVSSSVGSPLHPVSRARTEPIGPALADDRDSATIEHTQPAAPLVTAAEARPSSSDAFRELRTPSVAYKPSASSGSPVIGSCDEPGHEVLSPGELFSRANAARHSGQPGRAISLYLELQQAYPRSAEASMSYVSLGRMLLTRGQAERALAQFSRHLGSHGPLEEEALLGKAQALAALGKRSEERATWRNLLTRYPSSVYAAEAKERLGKGDKAQEP